MEWRDGKSTAKSPIPAQHAAGPVGQQSRSHGIHKISALFILSQPALGISIAQQEGPLATSVPCLVLPSQRSGPHSGEGLD